MTDSGEFSGSLTGGGFEGGLRQYKGRNGLASLDRVLILPVIPRREK